jgi:hypothetical protein
VGCLGRVKHTLSPTQHNNYPSAKKNSNRVVLLSALPIAPLAAPLRSAPVCDRVQAAQAQPLPSRPPPRPPVPAGRPLYRLPQIRSRTAPRQPRAWPEPGGTWRGGTLSGSGSPPLSVSLCSAHLPATSVTSLAPSPCSSKGTTVEAIFPQISNPNFSSIQFM